MVHPDGFTVAPGKQGGNVTLVICASVLCARWTGRRQRRKAFNRKGRKAKPAEEAKMASAYVVYICGAHFTSRTNCVSSPLPYNSEQ